MSQLEIDFSAAERFGILRRFCQTLPPAITIAEGASHVRLKSAAVAAVLRAICEYAGDGRCFASTSTLAGYCGISERHVRRCVRWLDENGLVAVTRRGRMATNEITPIWSNLAEADTLLLDGVTGHSGKVTGHSGKVTGHSGRSDRPQWPPIPPLSPSDPPTTPGEAVVDDSCDPWVQVAESLAKVGVSDVATAVAAARRSSLQPGQALDLASFFAEHSHRRDWGPGAIVYRFRCHRPDAAIDELWPPDGPRAAEYAAAEAARRRAEQSEQSRRRWREAEAAANAERSSVAELEALFGREIDTWPPDIVHRIVADALGDFGLDMLRRDPDSFLCREALLRHAETMHHQYQEA